MTQDLKELRDQITHHETMAEHHSHLAKSLQIQYNTLTGDNVVDWGNGILKNHPTKSHGRWQAWLKANGPATRKTIAEAVGLLTGDIPPYADTLGLSMAELVDAAYPDDMMLRLSVENLTGRGRPVDVYFLWSQRFDVRPLFGVGPERPDPSTLFGVVQPPVTNPGCPSCQRPAGEGTGHYGTGYCSRHEPVWIEEPPDGSPISVNAWLETHSSLFREIELGAKPTPEQRAELRSDAPEGVDANVAIMLAAAGRLSELRTNP